MKKIFILCSGLILAPSIGSATCTVDLTSVPSGYLTTGGPNFDLSYCSGTETYYACNSELGTSGVCYSYKKCTGCKSGYTKTTQSSSISGCGTITTNRCYDPNCYAGTYKNTSGSCISCSVGTYSDSTNASSCTTCPALSGAYGDSARSKAVNVANGYVTTAGTGSKSINDCYIKYASYYDTSGTFKFGGTCAYDGTVTIDPCADYTYVCTNSTTPSPTTALASNPSSGAACWAQANGKRAYFTTMGASASASSSSCESSCKSAISSAMGSIGSALRVALGCD